MAQLIYVVIVFICIAASGVYMTVTGNVFLESFRPMKGTEEQKTKYAHVCGPLYIVMGLVGAVFMYGLSTLGQSKSLPMPIIAISGIIEVITIIAVIVLGRKIRSNDQ